MNKTLLTALIVLTATTNAHARILSDMDSGETCEMFSIFKKKEPKKQPYIDPAKTEAQFKKIAYRVGALYSGTIRERGATFNIIADWKSEVVNAYAMKMPEIVNDNIKIPATWSITLTGGLYRQQDVTDDGLALAACHEVGHLIGGAPYLNGRPLEYEMSVEGQADFWGASVCLKRYFREFPEKAYITEGIPKLECDIANVGDEQAQNDCYRGLNAGLGMSKMLGEGDKIQPDSYLQAAQKLSYTDQKHPEAQCRLDTYRAASLCDLGETNFDFDDKTVQSKLTTNFLCNEVVDGQNVKVERRPECWFNQKNNDIFVHYNSKAISQKFRTLQSDAFGMIYFNHLPGKYTIRLVPTAETLTLIKLDQMEYTVDLAAASKSDPLIFGYVFLKKTNKDLKIRVEVLLNGEVINGEDDTMIIKTKSLLAF